MPNRKNLRKNADKRSTGTKSTGNQSVQQPAKQPAKQSKSSFETVIDCAISNLPSTVVEPLSTFMQNALLESDGGSTYVMCLKDLVEAMLQEPVKLKRNLELLKNNLEVALEMKVADEPVGKSPKRKRRVTNQRNDLIDEAAAASLHPVQEKVFKKPIMRSSSKIGSPMKSISDDFLLDGTETNDPNRTSDLSDRESQKSYSKMNTDFLSECFGFYILDLLSKPASDLNDLDIQLRPDDLTDLFSRLYEYNCSKIKYDGFPVDLNSETDNRAFMDELFRAICNFIIKNFNVDRSKLVRADKLQLPLLLGNVTKRFERYLTVCSRIEISQYYLIVVECKGVSLDEAVKQGLGYAKAAFNENKTTFNDEQTIYAFVTNGAFIRLIYYNPADLSAEKGFKLSETFQYLFSRMEKAEKDWMAKNTLIIRVIYSILYKKIELVNVVDVEKM